MKHHKKIIQQLIQHSKALTDSNKFFKGPATSQQSNEPTLDLQTFPTIENNKANMSVQISPNYYFQVFVQIGDGRSDCITMNQKSDPMKQAKKFCQKHQLEDYIVQLLAQSLAQQARKQKNFLKNSVCFEPVNSKKQLGAQKILSQNRMYKSSKHSQQLWKEPQEIFEGNPVINEVSSEIVKKMGGKQKIIQSMSRKFHQKAQNRLIQQLENEQRQFQNYSFHPTINPISRKVDETISMSRNYGQVARCQYLYQQHKLIQDKKEIKRRKSLSQISFKPAINKVSRSIMDKKKSQGQIFPSSVSKQRVKSSLKQYKNELKPKTQQTKRKNSNPNANQLCHHLYEQAKRREQKIQKQSQKIYNDQNNWRIIQNSNSLVFNLRQNRIKEVFHSLCKTPHKQLNWRDIDMNSLTDIQKIFTPVFKEMQQIDTSLTQEEFLHAGMRLLKYISPNQRALLIRKNTKVEANKQNNAAFFQINPKSKSILKEKGYGQQSIYVRGLIFRKEIKNQIQKGKQQKVRNQLKSCTFKPKIHGISQNIAY